MLPRSQTQPIPSSPLLTCCCYTSLVPTIKCLMVPVKIMQVFRKWQSTISMLTIIRVKSKMHVLTMVQEKNFQILILDKAISVPLIFTKLPSKRASVCLEWWYSLMMEGRRVFGSIWCFINNKCNSNKYNTYTHIVLYIIYW